VEGTYYCDETTPYRPPPDFQRVYHADVEETPGEFGYIVVKCKACKTGLTGYRAMT